MSNVNKILDRLEKVSGNGKKWQARCPAHDDKNPSLSITEKDDGRILLFCHAGCGGADVLQAIGLTLRDLYPNGPHGEFQSKKHRQNENKLYAPGFTAMQSEIHKLRAKLDAK